MDLSKFIPTSAEQKGIDIQFQTENNNYIAQKHAPWPDQESMIYDHLHGMCQSWYDGYVSSSAQQAKDAIDQGLITPEDVLALINSKK